MADTLRMRRPAVPTGLPSALEGVKAGVSDVLPEEGAAGRTSGSDKRFPEADIFRHGVYVRSKSNKPRSSREQALGELDVLLAQGEILLVPSAAGGWGIGRTSS